MKAKKLLAWILSVTMLITMIPSMSLATETSEEAELADSGTVTLSCDVYQKYNRDSGTSLAGSKVIIVDTVNNVAIKNTLDGGSSMSVMNVKDCLNSDKGIFNPENITESKLLWNVEADGDNYKFKNDSGEYLTAFKDGSYANLRLGKFSGSNYINSWTYCKNNYLYCIFPTNIYYFIHTCDNCVGIDLNEKGIFYLYKKTTSGVSINILKKTVAEYDGNVKLPKETGEVPAGFTLKYSMTGLDGSWYDKVNAASSNDFPVNIGDYYVYVGLFNGSKLVAKERVSLSIVKPESVIKITPKSATINKGKSYMLEATVSESGQAENISFKYLVYDSQNKLVLSGYDINTKSLDIGTYTIKVSAEPTEYINKNYTIDDSSTAELIITSSESGGSGNDSGNGSSGQEEPQSNVAKVNFVKESDGFYFLYDNGTGNTATGQIGGSFTFRIVSAIGYDKPVVYNGTTPVNSTAETKDYNDCNVYTYTIKDLKAEQTIKASATKLLTVNYNLCGGTVTSGMITSVTVQKNGSYQITSTVPKKEGYTFGGWINNVDNGLYKPGSYVSLNGKDIYLTAQWEPVTYSITYYGNYADSGTVPQDSSKYIINSEIIVPGNSGNLKREGYLFAGWNTSYDGNGILYKPGDKFKITGNITLFAHWSKSYKVTYYTSGANGNAPVDENVYAMGDMVTVQCNTGGMTYRGYIFKGWSTGINGSGTFYAPGSQLKITGDTYLYPVWGSTYKITYDENGGSGSVPIDTKGYTSGEKATVKENNGGLTLSGKSFVGWNTRKDGTGESYKPGADIIVEKDITLYAQWGNAYTVTYMKNDGIGTVPIDNKSYSYGDVVTVKDNVGNLDRSGYTFNGWFVDEDNDGVCDYDEICYSEGAEFKIENNTVLKANWSTTFRVIYKANGAKNGSVPVDSRQYNSNDIVTIMGNSGKLSNGEAEFAGWNTKADGTGKYYSVGSTVSITKNLTLYAQWGDTYKITYYCYGDDKTGLVPVDDNLYPDNSYVKVAGNPGGLRCANKIFAGWSEDYYGNGTLYKENDQIQIKGKNISLFAVWSDVYRVTYYSGSGVSGAAPIDSKEYAKGDIAVIQDKGTLYKYGLIFDGWGTSIGDGGTVYSPGSTIKIEGFVNLYPKWRSSYKVIYNANGATSGTVPIDTNKYQIGDKAVTLYNTGGLTKIGRGFSGWNTEKDGTGTDYIPGADIAINGDVTLYAQWDDRFTVNYDSNGGYGQVPIDSNEYAYNSVVTVKYNNGNLKKDGYIFNGWFIDKNFNGICDEYENYYSEDSEFRIYENVVLKANWSNTFKVTYHTTGSDSGKAPTDSTNYEYAAKVTVLGQSTTLKRNDGKVFAGWNSKENGTGDFYSFGEVFEITKNIDLYPVWSDTYKVTYEANGGKGSLPQDTTLYAYNAVVKVKDNIGNLYKTGYVFNGWFEDRNANTVCDYGEKSYKPGDEFNIQGDIMLRANWSNVYTIEYFKNTNNLISGTVPVDGNKYPENTVATVLGNTGKMKTSDNKAFAGWSTSAYGTKVEYSEGAQIQVNDNIKLYAVWEDTYTLTYDINGGTGTVPVDNNHYEKGSQAKIMDNANTLSKTGYVFNGWYFDENNNGIYDPGESLYKANSYIVINGNTTLKANWTKTYTVTYNKNGGSGGVPQTKEYLGGDIAEIKGNTGGLTKQGYEFDGWFIDENSNYKYDSNEELYNDGSELTVFSNVTLLANWVTTFKITYVASDATKGTVPIDSTAYKLNDVATVMGNVGNLSRDDGKIFDYWSTSVNGYGAKYYPGAKIDVTKSITLYANWKIGDYTVSYYNEKGAFITGSSREYLANALYTIDKDYTDFDDQDYVFTGWKSSYDGKIYKKGQTFNMPAANVVLTAVVTSINKYTISFDPNGAYGSGPKAVTGSIGETITIPGKYDLSKSGCRFTGWNTRADGKGSNYTSGNDFIIPEKNVVLYAQWAKEYKVRFDLGDGAGKGGNPKTIDEQIVIVGDYVRPVGTINDFQLETGTNTTDYYFTGWKNDRGYTWSFEHDMVNEGCFQSNGVMTLTAQWNTVPHYNFIFDDNLEYWEDDYVTINGYRDYLPNGLFDGTYMVDDIAYNTAVGVRCPIFARVDYDFDYWSFDKSGRNKFDPSYDLKYYENLKNFASRYDNTIVLYANWTSNNHFVTIDSNSIDDGRYYKYYSDWIVAESGSTKVYRNFYITDGELPPGLYLNSRTGEIYGIPTEVGEFDFKVIMKNDEGYPISKEKSLSIEIMPNVLYIDHNEMDYSKEYGAPDPDELMQNKDNLIIYLGSDDNLSNIQMNNLSDIVTISYKYENENYNRDLNSVSFTTAKSLAALNTSLMFAPDVKNPSISDSKKDTLSISYKREKGEDAGQYKLYLESKDVKLLKKDKTEVNSYGTDINGYSVAISGGFGSKYVLESSGKYTFTIKPATLKLAKSNSHLIKEYGENDPQYSTKDLAVTVDYADSYDFTEDGEGIIINYTGGGDANFTDKLLISYEREYGEDVGEYMLYVEKDNIKGDYTTKSTAPLIDSSNPVKNYNIEISDSLKNDKELNSNIFEIEKRSTKFKPEIKEYIYGVLKPGSVLSGKYYDKDLANNSKIGVTDTASKTIILQSDNSISSAGYLKADVFSFSNADEAFKVDAVNTSYSLTKAKNATKSADTSGNYFLSGIDDLLITKKPITVSTNTVKVSKMSDVTSEDLYKVGRFNGVLTGDKVRLNGIRYYVNDVEYASADEAAAIVREDTTTKVAIKVIYEGLAGEDGTNYTLNPNEGTLVGYISTNSGDSGGGGGGGGGGGDSSSSTKTISITCDVGNGGYLLPSPNNKNKIEVIKGSDQRIEIVCDRGYTVADVKVDGKSVGDDAFYVFKKVTKTHTFAVTFKKTGYSYKTGHLYCLRDASCPIYDFKDSSTREWYHDGVHFCIENGLMNGVDYHQFLPNGTTTRAMLVTILYRIEGSPFLTGAISFNDVESNKWYYDAIRWASRNGIVEGYNSKTFGPNDNITREQVAVILARYAEYKGVNITKTGNLSKYKDADTISNWAEGSIKWAVKVGLIKGTTDTTIEPLKNASRAEMATLIMRFCLDFL